MSAVRDIDDNINRFPTPPMEKLIVEEALELVDENIDFAQAILEISKKHGFNLTYEDIYEIIKSYSEE